MKEMNVKAYVRFEGKAENDCVIGIWNEEWFDKIQKLKDGKRIKLYRSAKSFTRTSISLRNVILCYFRVDKNIYPFCCTNRSFAYNTVDVLYI